MVNKVFDVLRHRGGRGDGAAARRRRAARDADARGGDGGGAEAPVHALSGVPTTTSTTSSACCTSGACTTRCTTAAATSPTIESLLRPAYIVPETKPLGEAARPSCGARTRTWRSWSTSTARRRASSRSRTCWRRSSARSTTSSTGPTSRSCGCRQGPRAGRGLVPDRRVQRALRLRACRTRTTTPSAASSSASSAARRRRATASRSTACASRCTASTAPRIVTVDVEIRPRAGSGRRGRRRPDGGSGRRGGRRGHSYVVPRDDSSDFESDEKTVTEHALSGPEHAWAARDRAIDASRGVASRVRHAQSARRATRASLPTSWSSIARLIRKRTARASDPRSAASGRPTACA